MIDRNDETPREDPHRGTGWSRRGVLGLGAMAPFALAAGGAAAREKAPARRPEVNAAILTPVAANLTPDTGRLAHHAKVLMADGCDRLILFGTTGEATSFPVRQRMEALEALLAAGVPADRLIVGGGCPALADSVVLVNHAVRHGCTNVLVLPPYFYKKPSDEGLAAWYTELIERVGSDRLALYLYHIPQVSAVPITDGLIDRLTADWPGTVVGMKDSSGDFADLVRRIRRYPDFRIFSGTERNLADVLAAGAAGVISATGNINAAAFRELRDRHASGDRDLRTMQEAINRVRDAFEKATVIPALKQAVAARYDDPEWNRLLPPLRPLAADVGATFLEELDAMRPELLQAPA